MNTRTSALFITGLLVPALIAGSPKTSRDLRRPGNGETVDVIVQYRHAAGKGRHSKAQGRADRQNHDLGLIQAEAVTVTAQELDELEIDPDVAYVSLDRPIGPATDNERKATNAETAAKYGWTGAKVGIAVIDSGVTGAEISGQVVHSESLIGGSGKDEYGHGTHVAGIIAGSGEESDGKYRGLAPKASIISLRVLNKKGEGKESAVIAAIQRAIALRRQFNIRVINLSLGRPVQESYTLDPLCKAVEAAWKAGIVVVVAAGNEGRSNTGNMGGYGTIQAPGNDPYVITVGAMKTNGTPSRADDTIASYSSKGPTRFDHLVKPDLVAPGNHVVSVMPKEGSPLAKANKLNAVGDGYFRLSGTSMAAPMVSAAAALMIEKEPGLTPDLVKARLMRTATKAGSFPLYGTATDPIKKTTYSIRHDVFTVGAGYLDIWSAMQDSSTAMPGTWALSAKADRDSVSGAVSLSLLWGDSVLWGDSMLWGESVLWGSGAFMGRSSILWGDSVVWNNKNASGNSILWGASKLWGTKELDSEATDISFNGEI